MGKLPPADAPRDLSTFLDRLRDAGELREISVEVDAELEVPEIHRRVIAAEGPALLFRNVRGAEYPLVTNLYGNARRIELAFGPRPGRFIEEIARLPAEFVPPTPGRMWAKRGLFRSLLRTGSQHRSKAPVTQRVQRPPDLSRLPATKSWIRDGGRFLTLPLVYTEHPELGSSNLGMYRIQLFDERLAGMHFQIGKGGGFHLSEAERLGQPLPVNVHLGGPPALALAAIAPLPENVPEILLASLALGKKLGTTTHPAGPLPIFADAEMCLVGHVPAGERRPEGPFGDHYGYYSEVHDYPVFRVEALLAREGAVFPATVVGKPRQEDFFLGDYLQELLSPFIKLAMPSVVDLWSYGETGYHSLAAAVVRERYRREAMASAFRILGEGQLSLTKFLLLTDRPVNLRDFPATLRHVLERADFERDLFLFANLSMDSLDYAGPTINEGGKGVLLGLGEARRNLPATFEGGLPEGVRKARVFTDGCLVLEGQGFESDREAAERVATHPAFEDWPLLVLVDDAERTTRSSINFLWTTFTRFDPGADVHAAKRELRGTHAALSPPILIDARKKPNYPAELFCDEATAELVGRRWSEYFPGRGVEMGDSDRGHLD